MGGGGHCFPEGRTTHKLPLRSFLYNIIWQPLGIARPPCGSQKLAMLNSFQSVWFLRFKSPEKTVLVRSSCYNKISHTGYHTPSSLGVRISTYEFWGPHSNRSYGSFFSVFLLCHSLTEALRASQRQYQAWGRAPLRFKIR